jgi:hypothetical protein
MRKGAFARSKISGKRVLELGSGELSMVMNAFTQLSVDSVTSIPSARQTESVLRLVLYRSCIHAHYCREEIWRNCYEHCSHYHTIIAGMGLGGIALAMMGADVILSGVRRRSLQGK